MEIAGEQGSEGTVNETGNQNFVFRGTGLTFEETAGETTHSAVFFLVFHLQRHEVHILCGVFLAANCRQKHGVAHLHDGGAIGLFGQLAGFDGHLTTVT